MLFAGAPKGGRNADPRHDLAYLNVVYENPDRSTAAETFFGVLDGGGIWIQVGHCPPSEPGPCAGSFSARRTVEVRGMVATLTERRRDHETQPERGIQKANVDWREISWVESVEGRSLWWQVSSHPDLYSEREIIDFVDRLVEIR